MAMNLSFFGRELASAGTWLPSAAHGERRARSPEAADLNYCNGSGWSNPSNLVSVSRTGDSIGRRSASFGLDASRFALVGIIRHRRSGSSPCGAWIVNCSNMSEPGIIPPPGIPKNISIPNPHGEKLAGVLDDTGSKELCILCHGLRSSKRSITLGVIASTLVTAFSAFRFDFAGNGESEGVFAYGNYWREVEDLRAVVEYWRGQGREINAIVGHSKGGSVVILYASKYGDVKTVVSVSSRFDLTVGYRERFGEGGMRKLEQIGYLDVKDRIGTYRVTLKSLQDRLSTDMGGAAESISQDCRVLIVHGTADEVVRVEDARLYAERIPNNVLRIIDGANHNYEGQREHLGGVVLNFIQGNLSKI
ncbi:hypothetical protein R1sor_006284 [Riccia sorocarpa]|uniref:Serine aminopeptidase S33 domain-containing protein n=1 Tax=Riccia sorocarpa TaxID=122646 RepID=A0ABD3HMG6_9MARC